MGIARVGLAALLLLLGSSSAPVLAAPRGLPAAGPKRSIVLVTLDTTRADRIGCYGRSGAATPVIDGIAARGARFAEAWSAVPVTLPSHLSILTGCYPVTHGVRDNGDTRFDGRIPTLALRLRREGWQTAAVVSASVLDSVWGANVGFDLYDDRFGGGSERSAKEAADHAIDLLKSLRPPFFLWVHFYDPHWKYEPPAPWASRFASDLYQGEIAFVDAELGRLLSEIDRRKLDPILAVVGDHGEGLGDHGERTHGIFTYRSTLHVPFLLAGTGIPRGRVEKGIVSLVDLAPTLLDLVGLEAGAQVDGRSLLPLLHGNPPPKLTTRWLYYESLLPWNSFGWVPPRGVTDGRFSYIQLPKREVHDLRADPGQRRNLHRPDDPVSIGLARRFGEKAEQLAARAGKGGEVRLTEEERKKLASLGYLSGLSSGGGDPTLDPKDVVDLADAIDKAKELHDKGRFEEAIAIVDGIVTRNPENVPALSIRGQALLALKRHREAAAAFSKVIARNPRIAIVWFDLGSSFDGMGEKDRAEEAWQKAISLEPHFAEPKASMIASKLARGEVAAALEVAKAAAASGAESAELSFEIGLAEANAGDLAGARRGFEAALRMRPSYVEAIGNLAQIEYREGKVDAAIALYRRAIEAGGGAKVRAILAAIYLEKKGDVRAAIAEFRAALAVETDPAERRKLEEVLAELTAGR